VPGGGHGPRPHSIPRRLAWEMEGGAIGGRAARQQGRAGAWGSHGWGVNFGAWDYRPTFCDVRGKTQLPIQNTIVKQNISTSIHNMDEKYKFSLL
jgi:hypothetical protein